MKTIPARRWTIGILPGYHVYEGNTISDYLASVFQGILAAAAAHDCNVLLACGLDTPATRGNYSPAWPLASPDTRFVPVGPWNTDGLIAIPPLVSQPRSQYLAELQSGGFPVVYAGPGEAGPTVMTDNTAGIYQAVEHLWRHGHRRIAYIAGLENVIGDSSIRLDSFKSALQAFGVEPDARLIAYGLHTAQGGRAAMDRLLNSAHPFTAVITSNLRSAIGAMQALREAHQRIPEDVAVIAVDDQLEAEAHEPPLTTVHLQTFKLGYQTVNLLLDYLAGSRSGTVTLPVPAQLVIRRSCGCLFGKLVPAGKRSPTSPDVGQHQETLDSEKDSEKARATVTEVAQAMTAATLGEADQLQPDEISLHFQRLVEAFSQSSQGAAETHFRLALAELLQYVEQAGENAYVFHSAISILQAHFDSLFGASPPAQTYQRIAALLDEARVAISRRSRRQTAQYLVEQARVADRLGTLTAELLETFEEAEILNILATHLPSIDIRQAQIVMFEAQDDDPVAWSHFWQRSADSAGMTRQRRPTRQFPPPELAAAEAPFRLALVPLFSQEGQTGFIAFDAGRLAPCGAITRQVAAALVSCQLYRQAAEGRRLAEEAGRLKTRFLSTVSHELRTPLNLIVGLSELMLREEAEGKHPAREDLERIHGNAQHLGFLIRDVLDLASSDAGQLRLSLERLDLLDVFQTVTATGKQLADNKGLTWNVNLTPERPRVLGDRIRLRQVALNLISNAVKFTQQGAVTFSVEADAAGGQVTISVSDTGLGIPPEEQALIFDEFRQSERTTSRGYGGLGLGLAISKHLVELHGGQIGVRSSGIEGEGATFYFTLPVLAELPAVEALALPLGKSVLLLAGQTAAADKVSRYLREQGFEVVTQAVENNPNWRARLAEFLPEAILFDQRLVAEQGWEIVRSLKEDSAARDVPIVFYSLSAEGENGSLFELDYRTKPLNPEQVARMLTSGLSPHVILIVDDDPYILDLHTRLVNSQLPACRVIQARHGRQALEILNSSPPDLVLLDLMMPEVDGFGVLEAMRASEALRDIPVIVLTAKTLTEADMARLNRSVVTVLEKGIFSGEETLAHLAAALNRTGRTGGAAQRLVRKAIAYIHANYTEPISREQLARYLAVSENYLTNCFQQELKISPLTFLNRYRIKQAKILLEAGDQNVTEVALAVGFSDTSYFGRIFQREVGISPSAYRRGYRKHA